MAYIDHINYCVPMLIHEIGDCELRFSVETFPKENHDWLCNVIGRQLDDIYVITYNRGVKDTQNRIKKTLGL